MLDIRPAQNMLVLKTPPGGAQPLAAAVDAERWKEVAGTLAGDDTVLVITPSRSARGCGAKARGGNAPMNDPLRVAVVGATGYAGFELARLLLRHPQIEKPTFYLRDGHANVRCLTELFPQLRGWGEAPCKPLSVEAIAKSGAEVAFLSTPHEASLELVPELLAANPELRIVDLSGAFRFREPETFAHWYKLPAPRRETLRRSGVRSCRSFMRTRLPDGAAGGQSRLLSDVGDSGAAAARRSGLDRSRRAGSSAIANRA